MPTIAVSEIKTRIDEVLDRVGKGEKFVITKGGIPVAVLEPVFFEGKEDVGKVIEEIRQFRKKHGLRVANIKQLIEEGRM